MTGSAQLATFFVASMLGGMVTGCSTVIDEGQPLRFSALVWHDSRDGIDHYLRYFTDWATGQPGPIRLQMARLPDGVGGPTFVGGDHVDSVVSLITLFEQTPAEEWLKLSCEQGADDHCFGHPALTAGRPGLPFSIFYDRGPGTKERGFIRRVAEAVVDFYLVGHPQAAVDHELLESPEWSIPDSIPEP